MNKVITAISVLLLLAFALNLTPSQPADGFSLESANAGAVPREVYEQYLAWRQEHRPRENAAPEPFRLSVFFESLKQIEKVNAEQSEYSLGLTQFADITDEASTSA